MTQQMLTASHSPLVQETRRQQTVARLLGAQSFATIPWRHLMQRGAVVQLHIGRCRFSTRLLLEDMGIHIEDATTRHQLTRWLVLGEKRLLPQSSMKSLARIESRARHALQAHAFQTELGNFVPETAYIPWRTTTEALREEYLALRDEIIANHRDLVRQVVSEYEVIAADTYQRLQATRPDLVTESQEQFVAAYCNRIAGQIPTVERIRESFLFTFVRVDSTQSLGNRPTEASALPEELPAETRAEAGAGSVASQYQQLEQQARSRAILEQDLRRDAQERITTTLDSFLTTIVARLRTLTYDAATDVLATLERRGGDSFSPRSTSQLNHLLAQVRQLNFFGDAEMDQMMARVQEIVDRTPAERQRSLSEIERTLRAIATTTRATLLDLEEETRGPRAGIAAYPTAHLVHAARAELRLPPLDLSQIAALAPETRIARAELVDPGDGSLWRFVAQSQTARQAQAL